MADETVTTEQPTVQPGAQPGVQPGPTHTTIIRETRTGGGTGIVLAVILLVAIVGGIYLFSQNSSEAVRDNAVAQAAKDVGNAATKVGDAAQDAVNKDTASKEQ